MAILSKNLSDILTLTFLHFPPHRPMPPDQFGTPATASASPSARNPTSAHPPEPRSFKAIRAEDRLSKHPADLEPRNPPTKPKTKGIFARMWPFKSTEPVYLGEHNPARGMEATRRVVREGVLDPRYKAAATRVTALICATPIMLYLTYELYQRRFNGKGQKKRPVIAPKPAGEGA